VTWEFKAYEQIDHTGDIGIRVEGPSREEVFRNAGLAFFDLLGTWGDPEFSEERAIRLEESSAVDLLVSWLSELNFLHQTEGLVLFDFEVEIPCPSVLRARARGRKVDPSHDLVDLEVKAVTYHLCRFESAEDGFWAQVIFDV
jgi:SHS2 domain-containing protein